jgi:pimeloyl-ACP methyl ester carboxylesterase
LILSGELGRKGQIAEDTVTCLSNVDTLRRLEGSIVSHSFPQAKEHQMNRDTPPAEWLSRLEALWVRFDTMAPSAFLAAMEALVGERPEGDARALYEHASAYDSIGNEAEAAPLYVAALAAGLGEDLQRQATIQYASTLRNLGRADEGLALLTAERGRTSDGLDDALTVFEALMLSDLGRDREALANSLAALADHLPRYRRSAANYAAALRSAPYADDGLTIFERDGTPPLPTPERAGHIAHNGADIWFASIGRGRPVILLHGGLGHSGNWSHQASALVASGYRVILIDSRGHGRSTRDDRPYSYELMAGDVLAVMDTLGIGRAALVGWSDGACTALVLGAQHPGRVESVLFFACNMDPSGTLPFVPTPLVDRCFSRHRKDYAALSATPDDFTAFVEAVGQMQRTEPNYTASDLAAIRVPVTILRAEGDEFIKPDHARYLADTIPGARLVTLPGVTHFAPLQRPERFNAAMLEAIAR